MTTDTFRGYRLLVPVTTARRDLAERLVAAGASVAPVEFIEIKPATDPRTLDLAVTGWCDGDFEWLVVTSRNAVTAMAATASARGLSLAQPQRNVACVGDGTRAECEKAGLAVSLVPHAHHDARGLVADFPHGDGPVLAPLGNLAAPVLADGLATKGWCVTTVEAYRTVDGPGLDTATAHECERGGFDAVVLTSGSVARRFAAEIAAVPAGTRVVAIGDSTAAAARAAGITVAAVAARPSYDAIMASLMDVLDPVAVGVSGQDSGR